MKNLVKTIILFIIISMFFLLTACAGARGSIVLKDVNHPVSMSPYIYDKNGQVLSINKGLTYNGGFLIEKTYYGTFYSLIKLSGDDDVNQQINDAVKASNSDAVVNLHYVVDQGGTNGCCPLTWLPIWPGTTKVFIMGDMVKTSKGGK